jgi:acyl-CoA synthetase (AMP-forming)/AMP-acid ligase II
MAGLRGTVYEAFCETVSAYATRDFLCIVPDTAARYGMEALTWSYAQAALEVERLRTSYADAGLGYGHRVGLMLENRPAFFFHWLALNALGASVVPLNSEWRSSELEYLIGHAELVLAVVPEARTGELASAARAAGREMAVADSAARAAEKRGQPSIAGRLGAETECALLYTSGTTGRPKGCVLPNEYFLAAGHWYLTIGGLAEIRPGVERLIHTAPDDSHERHGVLHDGDDPQRCFAQIVPLDALSSRRRGGRACARSRASIIHLSWRHARAC